MNELRQLWDKTPHKAAFAVVFSAWCALFHLIGNSSFGYVNSRSMFGWLYGWYNLTSVGESGDELCPLIPFLSLILLYLKRDELAKIPTQPWAPGLALVAMGVTLHVAGYVVQQVRLSGFAFLVGGYGLMGLVWGPAWLRAVAFPWFLLLFAIPVAAYTDSLTHPLRLLSTELSAGFCKGILGMKLEWQGTMVFHRPTATTGGFQFDVAPACSGIRSATVVLLITLVYAHLNFRSWWRRGVVLLTAVPLALLGNAIRLIVVFIVGDAFGQEAGKTIETKFGFITYFGALVGVFALGWLLREQRIKPTEGPDAATSASAAPTIA